MSARLLIVPLLTLGLVVSCTATGSAAEEGFRSLFDGKSLTGWEGDQDTFQVSEGAIHAGSLEAKIPQNEFLCTTAQFENFELRLEAKLVGQGKNAGIQFRSRRIPDHHEVIGYQCDMGAMKDRLIWGSLYDESRRRVMLQHGDATKLANTVKQGEYNDMVIRCEGPHIQIWVNGLQTVDYTEKQQDIARRGIIGLQIHGGQPVVASYRNIRIKELK